MNTRATAAALTLSALTACGSTELAAQPVLTTQGVRTTTPNTFTVPFGPFPSPCTGEILNGFVTFTDVTTVVTDASGGTHTRVRATVSGTYVGNRRTTLTDSGTLHLHVNMPSSGVVNSVAIYSSLITGSDGTAFNAKEHFVFVMGKGGIVRVDRSNLATNAYRCKRG